MIRPLRRWHKIVWVILAFLLPLLISAGLLMRQADHFNPTIPERRLTNAE